jgi:hypothetical protein
LGIISANEYSSENQTELKSYSTSLHEVSKNRNLKNSEFLGYLSQKIIPLILSSNKKAQKSSGKLIKIKIIRC